MEYIKKYCLLCLGLFIMAIGVGFSIKSNLGTSPISSVPYVISLISPLTVGLATIIMHCVFILLQIIILKKQYEPIQLLQLPVALLFGTFTDIALWLLKGITYSNYLNQIFLCIIGIILVAIGVSIEVIANVVTLAGEGLVLAICKVKPMKFGDMKMIFDCTLVLIALILSITVKGTILGVREGTIMAAILVGFISKQIIKLYNKKGA